MWPLGVGDRGHGVKRFRNPSQGEKSSQVKVSWPKDCHMSRDFLQVSSDSGRREEETGFRQWPPPARIKCNKEDSRQE